MRADIDSHCFRRAITIRAGAFAIISPLRHIAAAVAITPFRRYAFRLSPFS